jgi:hypothetical protein
LTASNAARICSGSTVTRMGIASIRTSIGPAIVACPSIERGSRLHDTLPAMPSFPAGPVKAVARAVIVLLSFLLEPIRRLASPPGGGRWQGWIAPALLLAAAVLFLRWGAEPSPERISLADLAAGKLSQTQTWIVVSGNLTEAPADALSDHVYNLADPLVPQAHMLVRSDRSWPLGAATISGQLNGGQLQPDGVTWLGQMQADDKFTPEAPPPFAAMALGLAGILVLVARRATYPVYFSERPARTEERLGPLPVTVTSLSDRSIDVSLPATLESGAGGAPARLSIAGMDPFPLVFHSSTTGIDVGGLYAVERSVPVLRVRTPAVNATVAFASRADRDGAFVALRRGAHA